jgi:hypothetical protein
MDQMTTRNSAMPSPTNHQDKGSSGENRRKESMTGHQFAINTGGFDPTNGSHIDPSLDNVLTTHHRISETPTQDFNLSQGGTTTGGPRRLSVPSFATSLPGKGIRGASAMATQQSTNRRTRSKKVYLNGFPSYAYIMPSGPALNFTMVDIIVILPNWFSNQQIMDRFMNNGLTPIVHVAILQEHHAMDSMSLDAIAKLREGCSDEYRRVMRTMNSSWKRAAHTVPATWDKQNISINHFLPDVARHLNYIAPKAIPFKDLIVGIKKLPEGEDAGDLTRALEFALHNQKIDANGSMVDYMFPDDIHAILKHIGPTILTNDHYDMVTRFRYDKKQKDAAAANRKRERGTESPALQPRLPKRQQREYSETPERSLMRGHMGGTINVSYSGHGRAQSSQPSPPQAFAPAMYGYQTANMLHAPSPSLFSQLPSPTPTSAQHGSSNHSFVQSQDVQLAPGFHHHHHPGTAASFDVPAAILTPPKAISAPVADANNNAIDLTNDGFPALPDFTHMPPDIEASIAAPRANITPEGVENDILSDIDALIAENRLLIPESYDMSVGFEYVDQVGRAEQLLHTCVEADDPFDFSQLASAARWCRDPNNFASEYTVGDLDFVAGMQELAKRLDDPQDGLEGLGSGMGEGEDYI